METFEHIVNWKLKKGSHVFPGPDGGTCINEAAIVAAGFEYKEVHSAKDCPPCFSRPIAAYAIKLNDSMPDRMRQELLMPFVTRLAGTADTKDIEVARVKYMAIETVKRILSLVCERRLKRPDLAERCRAVTTLNQSMDVSVEVKAAAYDAAVAVYDAAVAVYDAAGYAAAASDASASAADAADAAAYAAYAAYAASAAAYAAKKEIFTIACEILDGAIRLGNQSTIQDTGLVIKRMNEIRKKISA